MCDREIVCSARGMIRATAVGATGDALKEFNEALSREVNLEARDYSVIAPFPRRIIDLSTDCGAARSTGTLASPACQ